MLSSSLLKNPVTFSFSNRTLKKVDLSSDHFLNVFQERLSFVS